MLYVPELMKTGGEVEEEARAAPASGKAQHKARFETKAGENMLPFFGRDPTEGFLIHA